MAMNEEEREGRVVRTIPADTFAHRLLLIRAERGLTLREAAEKCGLNYGSWNGWESGVRPRDALDVTAAIAEGLGVDLGWLRDGGPLSQPERPIRRGRIRVTYPRRQRGDFSRRPRRIDGRERVAA